ncbi:MAG: hypothetical protein ACRDIB_17975, partial [Ardenticatenaceae bacterium]
ARGSIELKGSLIANGVADTELDDGDDARSGATTSAADTSDKKEGSASSEITLAASESGGILAGYEDISPALDLSSHDSLQLWIKSSVATSAGDLDLVIDDTAGCGSALESIDLPALAANTWELATIGITDTTTRTTVACVGLTAVTDNGAQVINLDDIIARGQGTSLLVTIANAVEGEPVDLGAPSDSDGDGVADSEDRTHTLIVTYTDQNQNVSDLAWTRSFVGNNDSDDLLEVGERGELTVDLEGLAQATPLVKDVEFTLEVRPGEGSALVIERRMPSKIDTVMNLQ